MSILEDLSDKSRRQERLVEAALRTGKIDSEAGYTIVPACVFQLGGSREMPNEAEEDDFRKAEPYGPPLE